MYLRRARQLHGALRPGRESSAPMRREYPATSAARIAASRRPVSSSAAIRSRPEAWSIPRLARSSCGLCPGSRSPATICKGFRKAVRGSMTCNPMEPNLL